MASAARKDFERRARLASASSRRLILVSIRTERVVVICGGRCALYTMYHSVDLPTRDFSGGTPSFVDRPFGDDAFLCNAAKMYRDSDTLSPGEGLMKSLLVSIGVVIIAASS